MGKTIAIANQKGGVGKTTTVVSMGGALTEMGARVLLIDADDSGNPSLTKSLDIKSDISLSELLITASMGKKADAKGAAVRHEEGYDVICADPQLPAITNYLNGITDESEKRMLLKNVIAQVKDDYDYIILDAAPSLNIMSINVLSAADEIIITSQAQGASEKGIEELLVSALNVRSMLNPSLYVAGLLITMVDMRTRYNSEKVAEMVSIYREKGMHVFDHYIPRSVKAEEWADAGKSMIAYAPNSAPARAYREFTKEYLENTKGLGNGKQSK